jgi:GT2 family glycosyltransferase
VVDDGISEDTRAIVGGWAAKVAKSGLQVRYIASPGPHGPAAARNHGWKAARGTVIAFTDDDTAATQDWLANGLLAFEDETTDAIWGRIVMPMHGRPTDYELHAKGSESGEFATANCFVRKSVLAEIGGFDERYRFAWREDADLYFSLLSSEAKVVHWPRAVMIHPIRPVGWGISLSQQKKVLFDALLFKKYPELYRKKIRARVRWDYYAIVASLLATFACLALGAWKSAAVAAIIWLALTMCFCIMRLKPTAKTPSHICEMLVTSALIPPVAVFWRIVGALRFRAPLF